MVTTWLNVSILRNIYFTFKHNLLYSHKPEWKTEFIMLYTRKPYTKSINSCPPRGSDLKAEPNSHIFFQSFESWLFQYDVMHSIWSLSLCFGFGTHVTVKAIVLFYRMWEHNQSRRREAWQDNFVQLWWRVEMYLAY